MASVKTLGTPRPHETGEGHLSQRLSQGFSRPDSPPRTRLGVRQLPRWSVSPPSLSPLMSPLHPAPFLVQKALKTVESEESVFPCRTASGMPEPPNSLVFGGKRAPDDHFAQFSAFGPEKRRIPARRACHRLSPLRHRFVTGPKSAQKRPSSREDSVLGKFESIMEPGDSSMSHGRARLVQGWLMNAPQVELGNWHFCTQKASGDKAVTSGDEFSGLEFAGFSGQKTEFGARRTFGAGFRRKTSELGGSGTTFDV